MLNDFVPERRCTRRIKGRYFTKYRFYYPEENRLDPHEFEAITLDISETGVSLVTDQKIQTGAHLIIKFSINKEIGTTLTYQRKVLLFSGTVVYALPKDKDFYRLGVYFGPPEGKNEGKFFDIVSSPAPTYEEAVKNRFMKASLHLGN